MKNKRVICLVICAVMLAALCFTSASADTGPKPSISVRFEGLGDELCYATLLSELKSNGPNQAWDGREETAYYGDGEYEIWKAFVDYKDADGFYFLQPYWQVNITKEFTWSYYAPSSFKILLYYPESGTFSVSDRYERYAFSSYYNVSADDLSQSTHFTAEKSYDYGSEILGLIVRIVLTIGIELLIAIPFGYTAKKQLIFLAIVNAATQIILNVIVNVANYNDGAWFALIVFVLAEIAVFLLEAILYCIELNKLGTVQKRRWVAVVYAIAANSASLVLGRILLNSLA